MNIKPFKLERFFTEHEFTAKYSLCNSDSEALSIDDLLALESGSMEKFHNQWLGYTEPKGNPSLRADITTIYDNITLDDVLVCSGAAEPIFLFSQAVLKRNDEVIVQSPCYQSLQSVPESLGCKVKAWGVKYVNNKPTFDLNDLTKLITPKTKVLFLNTPHNPTGYHFTKSEQLAVIDLARKYNCIIFCDEVYRELEHTPQYKIPAFADAYEKGVSLGVMSKTYGLGGLRIGWVASKNKEILETIAVLKEYTTICNSAPSEFLAGLALRNRKKIVDRNLQIVHSNLDLLDAFFEKYVHLFSWYKPNAGPISFVRMNFDTDDKAFVDKVIQKKNVLLLPGHIYDYMGYFRIGFGRKKMPAALEQFEAFINENLIK